MFAAEPLREGSTITPDKLGPVKERVTASLARLWEAMQKDARSRLSA